MANNTLTDRAERTERRYRMPYDEYFRMVDETTHSEWVDGEVTIFMPPSERHQRLHAFMFGVLLMYVQATQRGIVLSEPFEMKLRSGRSYREPDLVLVLTESEHRLDGRRLNGPADLAVEILSPESLARDQRQKLAEYEQEGVPEYWIVDGRDGSTGVVVYARNAAGRYEEIGPDEHGRLHSRVLPGFWLDRSWLTSDLPPNAFAAQQALLPDRFRA